MVVISRCPRPTSGPALAEPAFPSLGDKPARDLGTGGRGRAAWEWVGVSTLRRTAASDKGSLTSAQGPQGTEASWPVEGRGGGVLLISAKAKNSPHGAKCTVSAKNKYITSRGVGLEKASQPPAVQTLLRVID